MKESVPGTRTQKVSAFCCVFLVFLFSFLFLNHRKLRTSGGLGTIQPKDKLGSMSKSQSWIFF